MTKILSQKIGFIGCGNMGEALLKGLLVKGLVTRSQIYIADADVQRRSYIRQKYQMRALSTNDAVVKNSDIVILCVKPQNIADVLSRLSATLKNKLLVSIAAAISTRYIQKKAKTLRVIRVMPNTPALAGCGITAISWGRGVSKKDIELCDSIFSCVGETVHLKEKYIDAVTAVSGSGPAYFFLLMESMISSAVKLGIKKEVAQKLVMQTASGAAILQQAMKIEPAVLRQQVTSKGGTTEAALKVFNKRGFDAMVNAAISAACKRAKELSL